jgi:hypothetical protein
MSSRKDEEGFGCSRCGSYKNWELQSLIRSWQEDEKTFYAYDALCTRCGRRAEWITDNAKAIPERVKIREQLLTPDFKFDSKRAYESDLSGFDPAQVQPRLATGNQ